MPGKGTQDPPSFLLSPLVPSLSPRLPFLSLHPSLLFLSREISCPLSSSLHSFFASSFPIPTLNYHKVLLSTHILFLLFPPLFSSPSLLSLFLSPPSSPSLSLSAMTCRGPGLLCTGPSHSFSLNLTIPHMSIRRQPLPPSPGPAAMLRSSTICCIEPGDGQAFCCSGEAELSGLRDVLWLVWTT